MKWQILHNLLYNNTVMMLLFLLMMSINYMKFFNKVMIILNLKLN